MTITLDRPFATTCSPVSTDARASLASPVAPDWDALRRSALRLARRWSGADHEDLAQEAVIRYFREFGDGRGPDNVGAWLRVTVRRLAVDAIRRERGRDLDNPRPRIVELDFDRLDHLLDLSCSPSMSVIRHDLLQQVTDLLTGAEQRVFALRLSGRPSREVAEQLDLTPAAVDQTFARAKRRLRTALLDQPDLVEGLRESLRRHERIAR